MDTTKISVKTMIMTMIDDDDDDDDDDGDDGDDDYGDTKMRVNEAMKTWQ